MCTVNQPNAITAMTMNATASGRYKDTRYIWSIGFISLLMFERFALAGNLKVTVIQALC